MVPPPHLHVTLRCCGIPRPMSDWVAAQGQACRATVARHEPVVAPCTGVAMPGVGAGVATERAAAKEAIAAISLFVFMQPLGRLFSRGLFARLTNLPPGCTYTSSKIAMLTAFAGGLGARALRQLPPTVCRLPTLVPPPLSFPRHVCCWPTLATQQAT